MFEMPENSSQILVVYNMIRQMRLSKLTAAKVLNLVSSKEGSDSQITFKSLKDLSEDCDDLGKDSLFNWAFTP